MEGFVWLTYLADLRKDENLRLLPWSTIEQYMLLERIGVCAKYAHSRLSSDLEVEGEAAPEQTSDQV